MSLGYDRGRGAANAAGEPAARSKALRGMIATLPHDEGERDGADPVGCRRSPSITGDDAGLPPRPTVANKGCRYPADPPTVDETIAVMRAAGDGPDAARLRALIVILWRAGMRVSEALDLAETDLDRSGGGILVRRGKGGSAGKSAWIAGPGHSWSHGSRSAPTFRSVRCCA